ncbi:MAG: hypothetical protein GVY22_17525 [Gammaproteobacteria bacterium]|nr:hypothetical protein [Gammaproteobacteria bacterium]
MASTAPVWVREWHGPFRIDIEETDATPPVPAAATFEHWVYATCRRTVAIDTPIDALQALAGELRDDEWSYKLAESGAPVLAELYDGVADRLLYDADAPLPEIATRRLREKLDAAMARCVEAPSEKTRLIFEVLGGVKGRFFRDGRRAPRPRSRDR